jgi:hypothetical protein
MYVTIISLGYCGTIIQLDRFEIIGYWWGSQRKKTPLGRPRRRWVDKNKIYLTEIRRDGMDWIDLAQNRDQWRAFVNVLMNLRVP